MFYPGMNKILQLGISKILPEIPPLDEFGPILFAPNPVTHPRNSQKTISFDDCV
jgi:hypothetical protein